jgi:hypothetical protein
MRRRCQCDERAYQMKFLLFRLQQRKHSTGTCFQHPTKRIPCQSDVSRGDRHKDGIEQTPHIRSYFVFDLFPVLGTDRVISPEPHRTKLLRITIVSDHLSSHRCGFPQVTRAATGDIVTTEDYWRGGTKFSNDDRWGMGVLYALSSSATLPPMATSISAKNCL